MKIAIDARTMGSRPSGVGMYLYDFLKVMIGYSEFEFVLLSDVAESEYIQYFISKGVPVIVQGKSVYRSVSVYSYFDFIKKQLQHIKPDIFWEVNTLIPVRLKGDFKTMITVHDMFPIEYVEYFGKVYSTYFKWNLAKTLRRTDMILYNSQQTKHTTEHIFPSAKKIASCNAYIIASPLKEKPEVSDKGYLLYVGNMEKRKGVDLLLKGYRRYRQMGGTRELILAGKMQEEDIGKLLEQTAEATDGITYLDYVSHNRKMQLFAECSCFVFPSKAEGFGMPVIEVMKFGKPILVGNLDIYTEIAGDAVNRFDLNTTPQQQVENLAKALRDFSPVADTKKYAQIVAKYSPEKLGNRVRKFVLQEMRKS